MRCTTESVTAARVPTGVSTSTRSSWGGIDSGKNSMWSR